MSQGTEIGFRDALRRLQGAQKSSRGAPPYSLFVNRPLGRVFAALAYRIGLTPNQVTVISALFTYAGIAAIALGPSTPLTGLAVAALLVLGYALDAADGQLARLRGGGSLVGEWLDHMIDSGKLVCLHLAVAIGFWRTFDLPSSAWLLVPLVFCVTSCVHFFGMILVDLLARVERARRGETVAKRPANVAQTLLKLPTDYGVLCLSFLLLGWHNVFLALYTFLAVASTGYLVLIVRKWGKDVAALDSRVGAV